VEELEQRPRGEVGRRAAERSFPHRIQRAQASVAADLAEKIPGEREEPLALAQAGAQEKSLPPSPGASRDGEEGDEDEHSPFYPIWAASTALSDARIMD